MFKIITIGTAGRDAYLQSDAFRIIKDESFATGQAECFALGSKIEIPEIIFTSGGGASNSAVTFARQGLEVACVSKIGDDVSGQAILQELESEKIHTELFVKNKDMATAYSIILSAKGGERTILVYRGASEHLDIKEMALEKMVAEWIYLAPLGGENAKLFAPIVNFAKDAGIKVMVDPSSAQTSMPQAELREILKKVDILKLNQEEASKIAGVDFKDEQKIFSVLDEMVDGIVVMTKGADGVCASDGKTLYSAGIPDSPIIDRTGAGDAFGSGFLSGYIETNGDIAHAIQLGTANATGCVQYFGGKQGLLKKGQWGPWQKVEVTKTNLN